MPPPSAPALRRGIAVLRLLAAQGPFSLEEIARETGFPKSSLLRILRALVDLDLVARPASTKQYRATAQLVPLRVSGRAFAEALGRTLETLAADTGQTAEWYVPGPDGMVMVRRAEPSRGEIWVMARIGFLRPWRGELDAPAALGLAFFREMPSGGGWWTYDAKRARMRLKRTDVARRIARARADESMADPHCNPNGVRRTSALVRHRDEPAGVLALAESVPTGRAEGQSRYCDQLLAAARRLSGAPSRSDASVSPIAGNF